MSGQPLLAELRERPLRFGEAVETHTAQDLGRLRELDVAVVDDLDVVAPGVEEVEAASRLDLGTRLFEGVAGRFFVVDDEAEVPLPVRRLRSAFRERDELVADVDERHARRATAQLEVEDPAVELERVVNALDLERDVVYADEPRHALSVAGRRWLNQTIMAITGVYETVIYAADVPATAAFYADALGLRLVDGPDELAAAFRLDDEGVLLIFDPSRASLPGRPVPSHGSSGPGHVAFRADDGTLAAWAETLRGRGIEIEQEVDWDRRGRSIYVRDPAGNSVELVEGDIWPR
jgi:catechol 2,3-dioxygenase-like lactoylglutathione lyase family enzyme